MLCRVRLVVVDPPFLLFPHPTYGNGSNTASGDVPVRVQREFLESRGQGGRPGAAGHVGGALARDVASQEGWGRERRGGEKVMWVRERGQCRERRGGEDKNKWQ